MARTAAQKKEDNVIQMFTKENRPRWSTWQDTPRQRIAVRRNWGCRMIACSMTFVNWIEKFGADKNVCNNVRRELRSLRFALDGAYYAKVEKIDIKEGKA